MKKKRFYQVLGAVMLPLIMTLCAMQVQAQGEQDSKSFRMIQDLNDKLEEGFNSGNFYDIAGLYAENASIITEDGMRISGKKAISEYFNTFRTGKTLDLEVLEVGGSGKTLYQVGKKTEISESGEKQSSEFLIVWERQPDWEYKIYIDTL